MWTVRNPLLKLTSSHWLVPLHFPGKTCLSGWYAYYFRFGSVILYQISCRSEFCKSFGRKVSQFLSSQTLRFSVAINVLLLGVATVASSPLFFQSTSLLELEGRGSFTANFTSLNLTEIQMNLRYRIFWNVTSMNRLNWRTNLVIFRPIYNVALHRSQVDSERVRILVQAFPYRY